MRRKATVLFAFSLFLSFSARADGLDGDLAFARGDYAEALRIWRGSADAGQASAMLAVGTLYDTGHGVPQDFAAALSWYRQAAEGGNVHAMFNVAEMYDNGRGTLVDRDEAIKWYRKAATRGYGRAAYDLGVIYRDGDSVPRDTTAAIRYFRIAADQGIAAARANLIALGAPAPPPLPAAPPPARPPSGTLEHSLAAELGKFQQAALARDPVDPGALKVFEAMAPTVFEQADRGDGMAEYDAGFACEHGAGVPRDLVKAYLYYLRAATSSDAEVQKPALDAAAALEQQFSDEEHGDARQNMVGNAR